MIGSPSKEQAHDFALMLSCGAPAREAIRYFLPEEEGGANPASLLEAMTDRWMASKLVQNAIVNLQGKDWTAMSIEERLKVAVDKTYTEMAYFLYSRNYVELSGADKAKADTCRVALEAKLAGTAGKLTALEQFWSDVAAGKFRTATSNPSGLERVGMGGGPLGPTTQTGAEE